MRTSTRHKNVRLKCSGPRGDASIHRFKTEDRALCIAAMCLYIASTHNAATCTTHMAHKNKIQLWSAGLRNVVSVQRFDTQHHALSKTRHTKTKRDSELTFLETMCLYTVSLNSGMCNPHDTKNQSCGPRGVKMQKSAHHSPWSDECDRIVRAACACPTNCQSSGRVSILIGCNSGSNDEVARRCRQISWRTSEFGGRAGERAENSWRRTKISRRATQFSKGICPLSGRDGE